MAMNDLLRRCLPYCLIWQPDGSWVVTNRDYKPIGFAGGNWVEYKDFPIQQRIKNWSSEIAAQLDHRGRPDEDRVYLYGDGSVPTSSSANWDAYQKRLAILAALKLE